MLALERPAIKVPRKRRAACRTRSGDVASGPRSLFMTYAWYGHLRTLRAAPWYLAVLASWGVALFEYALQVPANRLGYGQFTLGQLKITQEIITLAVFVPFSIVYMREPPRTDYLWAALCLLAAAYFIFRSG
jgi:uncharacterized protein